MRGGQGGWWCERGVAWGQADGAGGGRVAQAVVEGLANGRQAAATAALIQVRAWQQRVTARCTAAAGAAHCGGLRGLLLRFLICQLTEATSSITRVRL